MHLTGQLSVDVLGLRVFLGKKTRYGRHAHPTDTWGFTREYLARYAEGVDTDDVIGILEAQGIPNDVECGRWLLQHDELVP